MNYKKFVLNFICFSILVLGGVAAFNYFIDPANLFNNKNVDYAVNSMVKGRGIINLINMDERYFKKKLINESVLKPETVVLGSSRSMGIKKEFFSSNSFANYSVSGAGVNDYIALWYIFISHFQQEPSRIVLGIDPWVFNKNNGDNRWESLDDEYYNAILYLQLTDIEYKNDIYILKKLKELLSMKYLKESVRLKKNKIFPQEVDINGKFKEDMIMPDGSRKYGSNTNNTEQDVVEERAKSYISNGNIYQLNGYSDLETDKFEKFVTYLKKNNVEIIFYLPPYHPKVYNYMVNNKKYENVITAENFLKEFALHNKIKIYGSYDPNKCDIDSQYFVDGMHMKTLGYKKMFLNINK